MKINSAHLLPFLNCLSKELKRSEIGRAVFPKETLGDRYLYKAASGTFFKLLCEYSALIKLKYFRGGFNWLNIFKFT